MEIGMQDDKCKADISPKFGELCRKNGGNIAQRMGLFLPDRLLFSCPLDRAWRGGGSGGNCGRHGGLTCMFAAQSGKSCA